MIKKLSMLTVVVLFLDLVTLVPGAEAESHGFQKLLEDAWLSNLDLNTPSRRSDRISPEQDAFGAVNGNRYDGTGFHTLQEKNPWWQVDLLKTVSVEKIIVCNRSSCEERAKDLEILFSVDGKKWNKVYTNNGKIFYGGNKGTKPLVVKLNGQKARYVRMQIPSGYLHLNEVEIYAKGNDKTNVALGKPAIQSSSSPWSTLSLKVSGHTTVNSAFVLKALELADRTLSFVQKSVKIPDLSNRLDKLRAAFYELTAKGGDMKELYLKVRRLRREIILSHPALSFKRLLINKRGPTLYSHQCDQYLGRHSRAGAGLVILDNWKNNPRETVVLKGKLPEGSILHPDLSFDAKKVLFSFCDHTQKRRDYRRYWIYEAAVDGSWVKKLTGTRSDPLKTWEGRETVLIEDWDPCYLPGGGFLFISTRNQTFGRCHGSRYTPAYLLYGADSDGSNIHQVSYGEANEWKPSVLHDGRIVYTRWDYINRHDTYLQSLWSTRPDGTDVSHFYGNYSTSPTMITQARSIPGSMKVVAIAAAHHSYSAGSILLLDRTKGEDGKEPLERVTPEVRFPEAEGRPTGSFCSVWPLNENMFLAAYQPDKLAFQGGVQRINAYSIYLVDTFGGRELIYRDPDISCFSPIPLVPREEPPRIPSALPVRPRDNTGVFYVQNVYKSTQPIEKGSIKKIRINKIIGQPTRSKPQLSIVNNEIIKKILGTVPVDEDGSVMFRAPSGVPLQFQLLDKNGMAVMTMRTVVYLHAGETESCVGCHEQRSKVPTDIRINYPGKAKEITPPAGPQYHGGFSFVRTVQPVLDRYCISCHGLDKQSKNFPLLGTPTRYNAAYDSLVNLKGMVKIAQRNHETVFSVPRDYFANGGKLAGYLLNQKKKLNIDNESFERIINWLDLNAQFYGDYSHNRVEDRMIDRKAEKELRAYVEKLFGEDIASQPLAALVNYALPEESRILKAPGAVKNGGWGQIKKNSWKSTTDKNYRKMLRLVKAVFKPLERHDFAGTCGGDKSGRRCSCGCCWVRKAREDYKADKIARKN